MGNGNNAEAEFLRKRTTLYDVLKENQKRIESVATKHLGPDRLMSLVYGELNRNPKLVLCTPGSVAACIIQASRLGLEIGGILGRCWLAPYLKRPKNGEPYYECQFLMGYKGMVELAYRSSNVMNVRARAVYEGDGWRWREGIPQIIEHVPKGLTNLPEKITHAYSVVQLRNGGVSATVLTRSDIEEARQYSEVSDENPNAPWVRHYKAMAMKTAVRQNFKFSPCSVEMALAVAWDEMAEAGLAAEEILEEPPVGVEPRAEAAPAPTAAAKAPPAAPPQRTAALVPVAPMRPKRALDRILDTDRRRRAQGAGNADVNITMPTGERWEPDPNDPHPFAPRKG